jgi:hypothetical protein
VEAVQQIVTMTDFRILDELHNGPATRMLRSVEPFALISPAPEESLPNYAEHRDGVTEIGKLSAEAIVGEFEAAAESIESLAIKGRTSQPTRGNVPPIAFRDRRTERSRRAPSRRSKAHLLAY